MFTLRSLACLTTLTLALTQQLAHSQTWTPKDAGMGILDESQTPPRIVERDHPEWYVDDIAARLGPSRYFKFWVVGPQPKSLVNRFGTPVYAFLFRDYRPGEPVRTSGAYSFSDEGWGTYQLEYRPGNYRVEVFLLNQETKTESLIKAFNYRVNPGKGSGQPLQPKQPGTPSDPGASNPPSGGGEVYLSDLRELSTSDIHGGLGKDRPYWTSTLTIAGRSFAKGIVTHPGPDASRKATVTYALNGQYARFLATLGSAADGSNYGNGTMNYTIYVDNAPVEQGRFPTPPATKEINVSVQGAQTLRLEVDSGGDGNHSDHAAWGEARLKK